MGSFINMVRKRIKNNKNFMCVVTGPTGSGKSYTVIRLAEALDKDFTIKDRVAFTVAEFFKIINSGKLKKGSVIVFEEAGVGMNAQEWQSSHVKVMNFLAQTFRHRNYIIFFTAPDFVFMAKGSRKLLHMHLQTKKIDLTKEEVIVIPWNIINDEDKGLVIRERWRYGPAGRKHKKILRVGLANKDLLREYEDAKKAYTDRLNKELERELKASSKKASNFIIEESGEFAFKGVFTNEKRS